MPPDVEGRADSEGNSSEPRPRPSTNLSPEQIARQTREDLQLLEGLLQGLGSDTSERRELAAILVLIRRVVERNSAVLEACAERLQYLEEQIWLQR